MTLRWGRTFKGSCSLRGRRGVLGTFWKPLSKNPFSDPFCAVKPIAGPLPQNPSPEPSPEFLEECGVVLCFPILENPSTSYRLGKPTTCENTPNIQNVGSPEIPLQIPPGIYPKDTISVFWGRLNFIHHQCWELPFCRFQRQRCIKILCPKDPDFYTPLALKTAKGQHLPALVVYKNQSPIFGVFFWYFRGIFLTWRRGNSEVALVFWAYVGVCRVFCSVARSWVVNPIL